MFQLELAGCVYANNEQEHAATTAYERRQQCGRRHNALHRTGIFRPVKRCRWERGRVRSLRGLCDNPPQRVPLAQDGYVGVHGADGRLTTGMTMLECACGIERGVEECKMRFPSCINPREQCHRTNIHLPSFLSVSLTLMIAIPSRFSPQLSRLASASFSLNPTPQMRSYGDACFHDQCIVASKPEELSEHRTSTSSRSPVSNSFFVIPGSFLLFVNL